MLCTAVGEEASWESSSEAIDKGLLMARDPILFYDEVPLYESELDDNGVSQLVVKVCAPSLTTLLTLLAASTGISAGMRVCLRAVHSAVCILDSHKPTGWRSQKTIERVSTDNKVIANL